MHLSTLRKRPAAQLLGLVARESAWCAAALPEQRPALLATLLRHALPRAGQAAHERLKGTAPAAVLALEQRALALCRSMLEALGGGQAVPARELVRRALNGAAHVSKFMPAAQRVSAWQAPAAVLALQHRALVLCCSMLCALCGAQAVPACGPVKCALVERASQSWYWHHVAAYEAMQMLRCTPALEFGVLGVMPTAVYSSVKSLAGVDAAVQLSTRPQLT